LQATSEDKEIKAEQNEGGKVTAEPGNEIQLS
jgi:hypothetical protein